MCSVLRGAPSIRGVSPNFSSACISPFENYQLFTDKETGADLVSAFAAAELLLLFLHQLNIFRGHSMHMRAQSSAVIFFNSSLYTCSSTEVNIGKDASMSMHASHPARHT